MIDKDFQVKIESEEEFFDDLLQQAERLDRGEVPPRTIERVSFPDLATFYHYCTPKRLELIQVLHKLGAVSIHGLAKHLHRHYKNVFSDVKALEQAGLVQKNEQGLYCVPWDEFTATIRLAS